MSFPPIPLPVCAFFCGPPPPNDQQSYNNCVLACNSIANCALTPDILYAFLNGIIGNRSLFITGLSDIAQDQLNSLSFRLTIYQQIPWILGFLILLIILIIGQVIFPTTAILLFIAVVLIAALFIYFFVIDTSVAIPQLLNDLQKQFAINYNNAQSVINQDIMGPLVEAIIASRVPCNRT